MIPCHTKPCIPYIHADNKWLITMHYVFRSGRPTECLTRKEPVTFRPGNSGEVRSAKVNSRRLAAKYNIRETLNLLA